MEPTDEDIEWAVAALRNALGELGTPRADRVDNALYFIDVALAHLGVGIVKED